MRALVVAVMAAGAAGAAGCCYPLPAESCVQQDARCWDLRTDTCADPGSPEPPAGPECGASRRTGTCEENGFARWCDGYFVRLDSGC
jgi:hypothetical protein